MKRKLCVPLLLLLVLSLFLVFNFSVQPTKAVFGPEDIYFEYGAESEALQPPWDAVEGDGDQYGLASVNTSKARTADNSIYMYQKAATKDEYERRVHIREYGSSLELTEAYISWWVYFDANCIDSNNADDWGPTFGGFQLWFGPSTKTWLWWTGGRFQSSGGSGTSRRIQFSYRWGKAGSYPHFDSTASSQQEYFDPNQAWCQFDNLKNTWVHFQIYFKIANGTAGVVTAWLNNNEIASKTNIATDPRHFSSSWNTNAYDSTTCVFRYSSPNAQPNIGPDLYQGEESFANWVWVDDFVVSAEKVTEAYGVGEVSSEFESWEDGFESNDFSAWNNTHYAGGGVAPSITSTYAYTGTYAANFTTDGADDSYADAMHIIQDTSEIFQRSYVRFEDLPDTNNTRLMAMRMERASTYITAVGVYNLVGNFYWCIDITGGAVNPPENYTLAAINADQWYLMEFYFNSTTNGNATLWINNVLQCEETGDYSSHGDLQQVYPYLYVEGLQASAKMVYHDNYRVDDVPIGGGTPVIIQTVEEDPEGEANGTITTVTDPLASVTINGTYLTDSMGYYEFTNLTYGETYLFVAKLPSGYYPLWVENVEGSFEWNTTHFLVTHTITETHEGYITFGFSQIANLPYISDATGKITSATTTYNAETRNFQITFSSASTATIETRERFTPSYYDVTGATDWFWRGLNYTFEVEGTGAVTVEWR